MEIVQGAEAPKVNKPIDYAELARLYNGISVSQAVKMESEAYNITLFKQALERRGLEINKDFQAFNSKGHCYVKKLTATQMEG